MKLLFLPVAFLFLFIALSCHNNRNHFFSENITDDSKISDSVFIIKRQAFVRNFKTWYGYNYSNIKLSQRFVGLDSDSNKIEKRAFLNQLITGGVVPFKIMIYKGLPVYKLYSLHTNDAGIQSTIQQTAQNDLFNYEMEGKELPGYDFIDLNNNRYNNSNTKGKTIVLKCWFIKCVACVREFPELNALVDEYKNRNDILFISLAPDARPDLITFLKEKPFKYAVVAQEKNYIEEKLKLYEFPTHLLIGKNGKIIKVTNSIEELIPFIKEQTRHL